MRNKLKLKAAFFAVVVIVLVLVANTYYSKVFRVNTSKEGYLYIPTERNLDTLLLRISPFVKDVNSFEWVVKKKKYDTQIRSGKFLIKNGLNNNELVNFLRSGKQTPVNLIFNNQHRLELLAGRISKQIEPDSLALLTAFKDSVFLSQHGFTEKTVLGMFVPNSYEVYWNISADGLRDRMYKEYTRFWNPTRLSKAQKQNLSIDEVIALASIVQKETATVSERPIVAGLYLNRYHKKWALQSDPTVIFALQEKYGIDFKVKRVLKKDLKIDSPYNTYKYRGIPPGPIAMPDISSIEAVLNPAKHNYYYMCASVEKFGSHVFAKNIWQHNKNARKYQRWLSKQGVLR